MALAGLLAACGGGAPTKHEFVARANAICDGTVRATRSIPPPSFAGGGSRRLPAMAVYLGKVAPLVESQAAQIHRLPRPTQSRRDNAALTRYLRALAGAAADYRAMATAARQRDAAGFNRAEAALGGSEVASLAAAYGLTSCAGGGPTVR